MTSDIDEVEIDFDEGVFYVIKENGTVYRYEIETKRDFFSQLMDNELITKYEVKKGYRYEIEMET